MLYNGMVVIIVQIYKLNKSFFKINSRETTQFKNEQRFWHFTKKCMYIGTANGHKKKHSAPSVVREPFVKATVRYYFAHLTVANVKMTDRPSSRAGEGPSGPSRTAGGETNGIAPLENRLSVSYKVQHTLHIWHSNPSPRDGKAYIPTKTCP